jgi:2-amino-4-hydroxy-6-hydroxymethyldihydropteridine diphosphokinase
VRGRTGRRSRGRESEDRGARGEKERAPHTLRNVAAKRAYIGLGANLGDRRAALDAALAALGARPGVEVVGVSRVRETDPWGPVEQPPFLNAAAAVHTTLSPREVLDALLAVERDLGRTRDGPRWGPRSIDLDLLLYGDEQIDEPGLKVPHPRLAERLFALEPLHDLDPALVVPGAGDLVSLLARLQ